MQANQNLQVVREREAELVRAIHANQSAPGMRELLEYARLKADAAHVSYLKLGPDERLHATEKMWRGLISAIETGPAFKETNNEGAGNG